MVMRGLMAIKILSESQISDRKRSPNLKYETWHLQSPSLAGIGRQATIVAVTTTLAMSTRFDVAAMESLIGPFICFPFCRQVQEESRG